MDLKYWFECNEKKLFMSLDIKPWPEKRPIIK